MPYSMRTRFLVAGAIAALALSARASPQKTPEDWQSAASQDLTAIHDILRDNAPEMLVSRDSGAFRRWLEQGLIAARKRLPMVRNFRGYYFVMQGYVGGFRDAHIQFGNENWSETLNPIAWPGFVLEWREGRYKVKYRALENRDAPPEGAQLISCDGASAEALARARDRYDGDFSLASGRYYAAPTFLFDRGNPFVGRPRVCVFRIDSVDRTFRLSWSSLDDEQEAKAFASLSLQHSKLKIERWGPRGWWIDLPSMDGRQDWGAFYDQIQAHLTDVRQADDLVIDLRGNSGGDGAFGERLVRLLWGDAMVAARQPELGPTLWRVSRVNRDSWASLVQRVAADPETSDAEKAEVRQTLSLYDAALSQGEATFLENDGPPVVREPAGPRLVKGRVVLLTDYACVSACLDFMDQAMAMPGVLQAGVPRSADTIFMELTHVPKLPSGLSWFNFPHKAWIRRLRGSNVPYTPKPRLTWHGALDDDKGLHSWLGLALGAR